MAQFCGNCGAQMPDNAVICGNCGSRLSAGMPGSVPVPAANNPGSGKKLQKIIIPVAAGAVALVALIIILCVVGASSGYKGTVKKYLKAGYENENYEQMVNMTYRSFADYAEEKDDDYLEEYYERVVSGDIDYFDDKMDSKYNIKIEILKSVESSDKKLGRYLEGLYISEDDADDITDGIKKVYEVKTKVIAKKGSKEKSKTVTVYAVKDSKGWSVVPSIDYYGW